MEKVTSFLSSLLRRGRSVGYSFFEQALTASAFEAEYNCSSTQASSRAASGLRDLMLLSTQHADCMLLGTAKTAAEDLAWHLDMAASLDRHYGRIRQERHADIIAAAPEPEPIQPPSTVHAAAAAGSRRTVLFNSIPSRSARRQRLQVWLQQQSDLVTGRTSPLGGDSMQPSQLPGPGLAAGAASRPTSALSSISSRGGAGIGIGGERPASMVFYANAAFAMDGRISPLGDEDVELGPEPGATSRPTSPLSALSSSSSGVAGGDISGEGPASVHMMFCNPLGEVGDKTKHLQACFSAINDNDCLKAKSLRSLRLQRPAAAAAPSRPTLLLPCSLPALLPCSSPAVPRGNAPALLRNHLESHTTQLTRSSSSCLLTGMCCSSSNSFIAVGPVGTGKSCLMQLRRSNSSPAMLSSSSIDAAQSGRSSALSKLSALRLSGASSHSFNSSQPGSPADCLTSDSVSSSLADLGSFITPDSASSSRQGSFGQGAITLLAAQDSTPGVTNASTTDPTPKSSSAANAPKNLIAALPTAAEFLAAAEAAETRTKRLVAEEDLADAEAKAAVEAKAAAKLAAAEAKAEAELAATAEAISAAALAAAAEALAAEEAMAAAEASSAAEATAPKAMQHCPVEATTSEAAASPNPKVAQPAGKSSKAGIANSSEAGTGKGRRGVKSSQRSTGNTPTGSKGSSSSSSSRPAGSAGAAAAPKAAAGNGQPSNPNQSASRARVPKPGSPAAKSQTAAVNVRTSNSIPGPQHMRGSKTAATVEDNSAGKGAKPGKSNVAFGRCV